MGALMRVKSVELTAVKMYRALLVAQRAADAIDQRALAGTVGPDETEALAGRYGKRNVFERDEAAEALAEIVDVKEVGICNGHGAVLGTVLAPFMVLFMARAPAHRCRRGGG